MPFNNRKNIDRECTTLIPDPQPPKRMWEFVAGQAKDSHVV
jgi:hypothetical protein